MVHLCLAFIRTHKDSRQLDGNVGFSLETADAFQWQQQRSDYQRARVVSLLALWRLVACGMRYACAGVCCKQHEHGLGRVWLLGRRTRVIVRGCHARSRAAGISTHVLPIGVPSAQVHENVATFCWREHALFNITMVTCVLGCLCDDQVCIDAHTRRCAHTHADTQDLLLRSFRLDICNGRRKVCLGKPRVRDVAHTLDHLVGQAKPSGLAPLRMARMHQYRHGRCARMHQYRHGRCARMHQYRHGRCARMHQYRHAVCRHTSTPLDAVRHASHARCAFCPFQFIQLNHPLAISYILLACVCIWMMACWCWPDPLFHIFAAYVSACLSVHVCVCVGGCVRQRVCAGGISFRLCVSGTTQIPTANMHDTEAQKSVVAICTSRIDILTFAEQNFFARQCWAHRGILRADYMPKHLVTPCEESKYTSDLSALEVCEILVCLCGPGE
jgi:hypothetical protein